MEIDVDPEAPRQLENARDLAMRILVHVGRAADDVGAQFQRLHHHRLAARIVEQPLLREHAQFNPYRPGIGLLQAQQRPHARQPDARIDLDMRAHAHRPLQDCLLQGAAGAFVNVGLGEIALRRPPRPLWLRQACRSSSGSGRECRTCRGGCGSRSIRAIPAGLGSFGRAVVPEVRLDRGNAAALKPMSTARFSAPPMRAFLRTRSKPIGWPIRACICTTPTGHAIGVPTGEIAVPRRDVLQGVGFATSLGRIVFKNCTHFLSIECMQSRGNGDLAMRRTLQQVIAVRASDGQARISFQNVAQPRILRGRRPIERSRQHGFR